MKITDRIQHAWNAFKGEGSRVMTWDGHGAGSSRPTHTARRYHSNTFSASIFNRIAMDASIVTLNHVKMDAKNEDRTTMDTGLHRCLTIEANIDQSATQFLQDVVFSMFEEGVVAIVPVDTNVSPSITNGYDILSLRTGRVTQWFPKHVTVELYDENDGQKKEVTLPKKSVAIIENPLYAIANGPNSTLQRLMSKMALLDAADSLNSPSRIDMMIQLPYAIKTESQLKAAEERLKALEKQMSGNKFGIAYLDATEKITQLSRPLTVQLSNDVKELSQTFYDQIGLTQSVFNGTASETEMRNYYSRTVDPIIDSILLEMERKFLTRTAYTQGQRIEAYRDPFKLVPIEQVATIGDTFVRNRILTPNELRKIIGFRAHSDPEADKLQNPNIADANQDTGKEVVEEKVIEKQ